MDYEAPHTKNLHYSVPFILNGNYMKINLNNKPYFFVVDKPATLDIPETQRLHYFIPAINTDIRFSRVLSFYDVKNSPLNNIDIKTLPIDFNWSSTNPAIAQKSKSCP
jgi:hypothetical protein